MATTSTLLRYIIVVAPDVDGNAVATIQGPSSVTLQVANKPSSSLQKVILD